MLAYFLAFAISLPFLMEASRNYKKYKYRPYVKADSNQTGLKQINPYEDRRNYKLKYLFFFLMAFLPPFFISAVRYGVGTDYFFTYVPGFNSILNGKPYYTEWGFNTLNVIIQWFTNDSQWLFVVTSAIFFVVVLRTIIHYSQISVLSLSILFLSCIYFWSLNNIRQALAVVIVFAGYPYLVNGKFFKYSLCILVGSLFHISAFIMLLPYILVHIKFIRQNFLPFIIIFLLLLPVISKILEYSLSGTKYAYYFNDGFNNWSHGKLNILYNAVFTVLTYYILRKYYRKDNSAYVLLMMQYLSLWISLCCLFINIPELIGRLLMYTQIFQVLLIPYCCNKIEDHSNRVGFIVFYIILYIAYLVYTVVLRGNYEVLPYTWIFGNKL